MEMERNHEFLEKVSKKEIHFKKFNPPKLLDFCFFKNSKKKYIVIAPGASSSIKCWPTKKFKKLIKQILLKYNLNIILCGTKSEKNILEQILNNVNSKNVYISCEQTLLEFIAIIRNSEFLIGNDSVQLYIFCRY